jgi:hypothetical protein
MIADLLVNSFILISRHPTKQVMRDTYAAVNPARLLNAFSSSPPLFDSTSPISEEALAFFHLSVCLHPQLASLVATTNQSNTFIVSLATTAAHHFAKSGYSPILAILFSSILQLLAVSDAAIRLNDEIPGFRSSYANRLISLCTQVCTRELRIAFGRILRAISPYLSSVTSETAEEVLSLFETIVIDGDKAVLIWTEAFALLVQQESPGSPEFRAQIFAEREVFARLEGQEESRLKLAVGIILQFIAAVGTEKSEVFPQVELFQLHPTVITTETASEWTVWINELFVRAFVNELRELDEIEPLRSAELCDFV